MDKCQTTPPPPPRAQFGMEAIGWGRGELKLLEGYSCSELPVWKLGGKFVLLILNCVPFEVLNNAKCQVTLITLCQVSSHFDTTMPSIRFTNKKYEKTNAY